MTGTRRGGRISIGFEETSVRIPLEAIAPLREVSVTARRSAKYAQIAASMAEVGIIEPPVVARDGQSPNKYHLLDGHLRIDILRERGAEDAVCLVALDDEAYTYNKRISRMATIQEHKMILNAISKGVPEDRLARALNVNIANLRAKRNLLAGICPEVAELLRDKHVPVNVFTELRFLKPLRQIEAAQAMITMGRYSKGYAKSLVAATPADQLVEGKLRRVRGLSADQIQTMQRETENLDRAVKRIERDYGVDHLDLVLATGYVRRLLGNARIVGYLARHEPGILSEFQKMAELQQTI